MPAPPLYDVSKMNFDKPQYSIDDIRRINSQRHEMEQLTAVVHVDEEGQGLVGYKDITDQEFWIQGHMPGFPLMPGVVLCECAAQLAGFFARKYKLLGGDFLGFGGMSDVRFRRPVYPDCRLILMAKTRSVRRGRRAEFEFQGYVEDKLVFNGVMIGVPISVDREPRSAS